MSAAGSAFAGTRFTQIPACDSGPDGTHILGNVYEYAAAAKQFLTCAAYALWAWAYLYGTGYVLEFATALFPFSFGAYMSILGRNMINVFGRY